MRQNRSQLRRQAPLGAYDDPKSPVGQGETGSTAREGKESSRHVGVCFVCFSKLNPSRHACSTKTLSPAQTVTEI